MSAAEAALDPRAARLNPILLRCIRARLRPRQALAWGVVAVVICSFIFALVFVAGGRIANVELAAKTAIIPLLVLQSFILLLLGTGAVATGMALERDIGILDFHRMTPMSPAQKLLGFLFGLPIREWFLFALTMPFMLVAIFLAKISILRMAELYVVFLSGVFLYHLTGMTAGLVSKRARRASWFAQATVLVLYFVLPQVKAAGFETFSYLTMMPTLRSVVSDEMGTTGILGELTRAFAFSKDVPFFTMGLRPSIYTLLMQGLAALSFLVVVRRKFRDENAAAFGKKFAVAFFAVLTLLLVGSVWPLWAADAPAPTAPKAMDVLRQMAGIPKLFDRSTAASVYFLILTAAATFLLHLTTPNDDGYRRGLRRAERFKQPRAPRAADEASSLWVATAFAVLGAAGYGLLAAAAMAKGTVPAAGPFELLAPPFVVALITFTMWGLRTRFAQRGFWLAVAALWVLPMMLLSIAAAAGGMNEALALVGALSPVWVIRGAVVELFAATPGVGTGSLGQLLGVAIGLHAVLAGACVYFARAHLARLEAGAPLPPPRMPAKKKKSAAKV